mgnify:CR=1 FL=1
MDLLNGEFVSIITPAFNASKTLLATYDSLLKQTHKRWEWIVIDDASKDDTISIAQQISLKDSRVRLFQNASNKGAAYARNIGISASKGRYVAFLDADDIWLPQKLESQLRFIRKNGFSFVCSSYEVILPNGKRKIFSPKHKVITYKSLLKTNDVGCLTVMYDKQVYPQFRMPLDATKREDYAAWLDVTRNGRTINVQDEILATYRVSRFGVSSSKLKMIKYQYLIFRKHEKFGAVKSGVLVLGISFRKVFCKAY